MSYKMYSEMRNSISLQKHSVGNNQLLRFQQAFVGWSLLSLSRGPPLFLVLENDEDPRLLFVIHGFVPA
jgi:hypothetical protein